MLDVGTSLPLLARLGGYLKSGLDHYVVLRASGAEVTADGLAAFLEMQMVEWDPEVRGRKLLDPETRRAAARFLGGVAMNLSPPETR